MKLKENYLLAGCCHPATGEQIAGYCSHEGPIKVHRIGCPNLIKTEPDRLITLSWEDITESEDAPPDSDYLLLDEIDFRILDHHARYGVDYSRQVAGLLHLTPNEAFDRHAKLRGMTLLVRVAPAMIQYRKNLVPGKWIKHRNHTYYELTPKGQAYLNHRRCSGR